MQDNLPIVEGPSLSLRNNQGKECPIRCSEVAGDSETVFCRIAWWESLGCCCFFLLANTKLRRKLQVKIHLQNNPMVQFVIRPTQSPWNLRTLFQNDGKFCFFFCCHDKGTFPFPVGSSLCFKKIIFYSHANEAHYHKKGFALTLVFKVRVFGNRKWLVGLHCLAGFKVKVFLNSASKSA